MLYYIPLECYPERYTMQWSAPKTGWLERNWIKHNIPYTRIDSDDSSSSTIQTGYVLDAFRRSKHGFSQVLQLIDLAQQKKMTSDDIIYFDDFWHPGIEMLPYTFHLLNISPKMFAFCHAQSVDEYDFTHPMRHWMRSFEKGIGTILSGVFVNSDVLEDLLVNAGICDPGKVHVIGHIFSEEEVRERMPKEKLERTTDVIFTSRWDDEKNPLFFLQIVDQMVQLMPNIKFMICTSSPSIRSNNPINLLQLNASLQKHPNNLILKEGLSKEEYYRELSQAKIQINTADQDFVSIALLEASVAGCYPLYPDFRSFPQVFQNRSAYMYTRLSVLSVCSALKVLLPCDFLWKEGALRERAWIHERHNTSWARMLNIMMGTKIIEVIEYA